MRLVKNDQSNYPISTIAAGDDSCYAGSVPTTTRSILIIAPASRWRDSLAVLLAGDLMARPEVADTLAVAAPLLAAGPPGLALVDMALVDEAGWRMAAPWVALTHTAEQASRAVALGAAAAVCEDFTAAALLQAIEIALA